MTALAANKHPKIKEPKNGSAPVAAATIIYAGSMVCLNAAGNAVPASDTAALTKFGIATDLVDNSAGAAGDLYVTVQRTGVVQFAHTGAAPTNGLDVYAVDDQTVAVAATTTNDVQIGKAVGLGASSLVWVDIDR